jgi:hypothetical protein
LISPIIVRSIAIFPAYFRAINRDFLKYERLFAIDRRFFPKPPIDRDLIVQIVAILRTWDSTFSFHLFNQYQYQHNNLSHSQNCWSDNLKVNH